MPTLGAASAPPPFATSDTTIAREEAARAMRTVRVTDEPAAGAATGGLTTAPPLGDSRSATSATKTTVHEPASGGLVATTEVADAVARFQPFAPSAALPQLSPWTSPDSNEAFGAGLQPERPTRRYHHSGADSFTPSTASPDDNTDGSSGSECSPPLKPSAEDIATAFTPLRKGGKIERTTELMERVARVKARFRARQFAVPAALHREEQ
jgi:hypothetical protein